MAATYTDNGTNTPNGSHKEFTYTFPVIESTDVKVALNGITQATTKYTVSTSPAKIEFNNTSVDSTVQEATGAPKNGVTVRVYRETAVGKASGDEDPKAVFAAGSSVRAADLNSNFEQLLFASHEKQNQLILAEDIDTGAVTSAKILDNTIVNADVNTSAAIAGTKVSPDFGSQAVVTTGTLASGATTVTGNITVSGTVDGRDVAADGTKLDGIESGATADQSNAEIRAAVEAATDSNVFTDADHSKLNGIETSATADQTAAEIRTLVESASDSNVFTDADHTKLGNAVTLADTQTLTNKTLTTPVINDFSGTAVVTSGTSTSDNKTYSAKRAGEIFYGKDTAEEIQSGETWSAADNKVATTAAIDARIVDLVDDVGGFVPIANETSFPTANPDVNNGAGTLVSIKALASNLVSNGSGVATITNGAGSGNNVTISGLANSTTYAATFGMIVETTTTSGNGSATPPREYTFHRQVPKATEVTTVAGNISNINSVASNSSNINSAVSNASNINSAVSNASNINSVAGNISNVNTVAGNNTNINAVAGNATNINTVAGANSNITSVAGSIANINTTASNISDVSNFADLYQIATSAPSTDGGGNSLVAGDLWFDSSSNKTLKVHNGSAFQSVSPTQSVLNDISIVSGQITYLEDLGSIADALQTGTGNNINTVATSISNVNTVAGAIANVNTVAADATDIGVVAGKATEIGRLGTADAVSDMNTLGTTAIVSDMDTLADISSNITTVAGVSSNVTTVAGIASNVTSVAGNATNINAVAADSSDIGAVAGKATEIGRLGTTAAVADLAILGTTDVVADMNTLATTAIVSDMDTLADISSNITTVAGISANVTTVAGNNTNVSTVASNNTNVTTVAGSISNVNTVGAAISNVNTAATNISSINTAASNISNVNNFTDKYQIASSNPSTDGGGNSLAAGDLYFNTSANELKVYNGSAWQGGVTATGNLAGLGSNTFTGNQTINANIVISGTVDGRDVATDGTKLDGIEASATADQTAAEIRTLVESASDSNVFTDADHSKLNGIEASATADQTASEIVALIAGQTIAPNVITTTNLTLDFGSIA